MPVWSIGFLSPVFAGYLAATVAMVVALGDKLGRFVSAEELCEYTRLSPNRIDDLRDLMIFP